MINFGAQIHRFTNPFAGFNIRYPKMLKASVPRETLSPKVLSTIFANGVAEGHLDTAILPLLGLLTSRRLALLVYLRGSDIRLKDGVWVAQVGNITEVDGTWQRVPNKTDASLSYFVLHGFLEEIGFIDWAIERPGWIFEEPHDHPDPGDYESKVMNRLFKAGGAVGANKEVFHSLRHMAIDANRDTDTRTRDQKLQSGHALGTDEHETYGSKTIKDKAAKIIRDASLPAEIDFGVFLGLDFDELAKPRRSRHSPRRKKVTE
jgi:integrase